MGAGRLSRSELFAEVFGGSTGPNMVSSEFGDLMVAPASEDKVSAPKVFEDETSTPDVFEENVSRRDQILKSIDSQLAKIDSIESANKDPWSREMDRKSRNTYYFDTSVPISIPELHPEQKKLEAARVELRAARKNAEAYNETDYADGERKGGAKPFYERLADGLTNSTQDDMARMLTMGWYGLDDKKRANDALNKSANGARLTEAEQSILDAFSLNTDATQYKADHGGATAWGNIGEGIPGTVEFMLGLAATGGSLGVTSKIISTGILKGAGKIASREAVRTLATSGPLNNLAERANSQFRIDETGAAEKYNPQNFTAMLIKSYLSSYAENFSEQVGNLIPKGVLGAGFNALAPKLLGSKIAGQVGNGIGSLADNTKKFRDVLQKTTNWNGTVGEFLEEEFNNIVEPIITLEPERMKDNFSVKNQLTTLGSVAVFGGAMHALSAPSIAMDIARTGSMNKRVNGALGNIENEEFRKGVFQAVKRGTSIEDKATKLSDLNWADVSAADRANAVDAFTWNTNLEVYKGLQQQEDIQQETTTKINEYNNWFKTNANEQSGNIEEIETEAGDRYRLRSGTLEGAGVDGTVFARNIATGEIEQLGVGSIKSSPKVYGYEEGLKQILTEFGESSATAMAEAESAELEADAQRAGVPTDFYTLGDDVQLSDGSVVGFLKYHNDGSGLAEVYKIDPETLEQVSFEVKTSQITGAFVQPEQTEQPEQIVPNQELQTPHVDTPKALPGLAETSSTPSPGEISAQQEAQNEEEVIPRQKDGTPDYDAMPPEMFFNEYSRVFSQDEALEILNEELSATRNQVLALEKKAPSMTSRNEKILNKRASSKLQAKERELLALIESKRQALNTANTPVQSASVSDAVRQRYEQAPKEFGIEKSIIAPNDEVIPGRYVLIESGSVTPSHDPITFAPSAGFPTTESGSTVNDRDYSKDKDAQKQVVTMAQKYNGRAIDNPVVITPDGVVISGNNRTMSGDLAAANGTDSAYLQHLTDNAAQYGFAKEQIKQFKHPRIVFEAATQQPYNTETFAKFNAQETKTQNKVEKAISRSEHKMFFEAVVDHIGLDAMLDLQISELAEEVGKFNNGVITKMQLGREYVAYLTENYFAVDDFSRKSEELFIDLSNPLTNDVIGQILKSTNNGTGKIGIIPQRAARIRIVQSSGRVFQASDVNRSRTRSADTALPEASDGSRMGDAEANAGGADQQRGLEDSLGSDNDSISRQNQSGTDRDQQADSTRQTESDGFTEQAGDTGIGGANETKIVTDSDVRNLSAPRLGETNTIVTADRIEELRRRAKEKLKQLNSGFDPELFAILTELSAGYIEAGVRKFSDFTNRMVSELGDNVRPYLASMYEGARRFPGMEKISKEMDSTIYVDNYTQEHAGDTGIAGTNKTKINTDSDVRNLSGHSQRNSTVGANEIQVNEDALLDADRRRGGQVGTKIPSRDRNNDGQRSGGESSSVLPATVSGKRSNNEVSSQDRAERRTSGVDARGVDVERVGMDNTRGDNDNNRTRDADDNEASAEDGTSFRERTERAKIEQKKAEVVPVALMDMNNIRKTLPLLLPEQQDDVMKAETRFYSEKHKTAKLSFGKGMMFTNGTGTGKTFTGFGIIKRFYKLGKKDILIIVPAEAKIKDWTNEAKLFGLDVHTLESIKDRGKGISVTTFANFRANNAIKDRELDLIVYDECHRLMESNKGDYSSTTRTHFQMCNRNLADATIRIKSVHPLWLEEGEVKSRMKSHLQSETDMSNEVAKLEKRLEEIRERQAKIDSQIEEQAQKAVEKTKVVYLSATPFKSYFNLRYANGTLFNWDGGEHVRNGSRIDSESAFMLDNFGSNFEWKSHRLQAKSGSNAEAIAMQEVEFADKLMESGAMSSRAIESNMDYSREFPLITLGRADVFNQGFNDIFTFSADAKFRSISEFARKVFYDYNYSTQLYESLRAYMSINRIKQHIDLGRKVVVFNRRKQANATPPFRSTLNLARNEANKILSENFVSNHERMKAEKILAECNLFENEHQELLNYEQSLDYSSAIDQITKAFGTEKVVTINGDTPKSSKSKNIDLFNSDTSKVDIIVIQEEAGKEGISLHDKTGKHQRVLMNMSLPISSTTALQIEGRIYRIGQESNAIFEYPLLGLDMEIANFGQTINRKLSTTENLATGSQARDLIRSFAEGVLNNSSYETPNLNQGIGGKEYDKRNSADVSAFHKAVLVYQTNQRNRTRRDQRDGTDFYATPEPVGFKMVEMLNLKTGNSVLEPSAGDGRIAMWFPESSNSTIIEPSHALFSKASVRAGGGNRKSINSSFEDFNIINKFDGIAMNPPFGQGGATAIAHIEKAFTHLKDNGRIVAIVPRGSMDKKLDNFLYGEDAKGKRKNPNAHLIASINLPASTFEQAGTSVATQIVIIDKISSDSTPAALKIDLSRVQNIQELFSAIENLVVPERGGALNIDENTIQENAESQFELFKQKHSKTGEELYTVEPKIFLANNWNAVLALAKKGGGYYSSYSNKADNVRSGFIFKSRENAEAFLSAADNILGDQDIRYRESSFNGELTQEMEQIKDEAIQRGDYMMAPNGEPSNLNENQWLQVRTTAFKKWFGDWGKAARIGKLRSSETVKITGKEVIPSEDMKEYRRNALEYGKSFKGEYINQDTGISILVSNVGLDKLLSHDKQNIPHIQSIAAIPQLIENSVFITELQPGKDNHKFDSYKLLLSNKTFAVISNHRQSIFSGGFSVQNSLASPTP